MFSRCIGCGEVERGGRKTYCDVAVHVILDYLECSIAEQVEELDETFASFEESCCIDTALSGDISEGLRRPRESRISRALTTEGRARSVGWQRKHEQQKIVSEADPNL